MNFYSTVIMRNTRFRSPSRIADVNLLENVTRLKVQRIISDAKAHGIKLLVFETYRSKERQESLFNQGASQLRHVGVHHFGLACDLVKTIDGEPFWKGSFAILGSLAYQYGLI